MQIIFNSNFGNFDYGIRAEVSLEQLIVFGGLGLGQVGQRTPCTDAEKEMVGASWPKNKKGEPSRPKGFERSSIEFSEANAEILRYHLETLKNEHGAKFENIEVTVTERLDKVESKWAAEKALIAGKGANPLRLRALAKKVGFEVDADADDEAIVESLTVENVGLCQAIRAFQKALLAEAMAD